MKNRKVPKLRFKEFTDEWEEKRLGEITQKISNGISLNQNFEKKGYKVTRIETISDSKINIEKIGYIETDKNIEEYKLKKGNLLFSNINSVDHIGKVAYIDKDYDLYHGMNLLRIIFNENLYSKYFYYLLGSAKYKKLFERLCNKAVSQASINQTELGKIKILCPYFQEQQKIADFLSCVDTKISLTEEKLENLKIYKKGIMQKVFSQEIRFKDKNGNDYPEWEETKLGDLVEEYIEKTIINNQYQVLSSTATGIYLQEEYFNRQIASSNNIGYKIIKRNHLVLSPQNLWLGNINVNLKYEIGIVFPSYKIFSILENKVLIEYLKEIIKSEQMLYEYKNASEQGASIVRRNLNIEQFYNIKIVLPILEEQQKIADFLSSIDEKIEKTEKKLNELKEFKKGLLQKMFV